MSTNPSNLPPTRPVDHLALELTGLDEQTSMSTPPESTQSLSDENFAASVTVTETVSADVSTQQPPEPPVHQSPPTQQPPQAPVASFSQSQPPRFQASTAPPPAPVVIRRKLTSFVGFSNLPQQWHQKSIQQGFDLNLMVVGESGLGKSTLLNTLFEVPVHDLDAPHGYDHTTATNAAEENGANPGGQLRVQTTHVELEESGVKLRLNVIDTPGFGDSVNNLDAWKVLLDEIDRRFDEYFEAEESLEVGARGTAKDTRVHACLFFIEPSGHTLKPLDVVTMKKLHRKVNLVPVIAKSDAFTEDELALFKRNVLTELEQQEIEIFAPPSYANDDDESKAEIADLVARTPFAVIGSTQLVTNKDGRQVLGREYPWGVIEVLNEDHNDFVKLRALLVSGHLEDLRDNTAKLYEKYRSEKLFKLDIKQDDEVFATPDPAARQEEERRAHEERLAKMESEMRAVFQKKVTEKEAKLKGSESELYQKHSEIKEQLDKQRQDLEQRKAQLQQQIMMEQERRARKNMMR